MSFSRIDLTGEKDYLTHGEVLFLSRRRLGITQTTQAYNLCLTRHKYALMERDEFKAVRSSLKGGLLPHEKCVIYRRRCHQTQKHVASKMSISRLWVNRMEQGWEDCTQLLCHWES